MMMLNFDFVLRLLVAGILGAIIGLDREYRAKEAGYRTHSWYHWEARSS